MELWKQAYRAQFGSDADDDVAENADDVEAWRVNWEGGYAAGEEWAISLLPVGAEENEESEDEDEGVA